MKILILGGTGMLGFQLLREALKKPLDVHVVLRDPDKLPATMSTRLKRQLHILQDVKNFDRLEQIIREVRPDYLINCIGIVKQSDLAKEYIESITVNSLLPHHLQRLGTDYGFKLIHISTDCVFSGCKGNYSESDVSDAEDLYGRSKYLGEVGYGCALTLRTSIIGHELTQPTHGLIEWFLAQQGTVDGFTRAIFSGLTTRELSNVILDVIIPRELPAGLYQVASSPISKYDLLSIVADVYGKKIRINPSEKLVIDRSLDGSHFEKISGYKTKNWRKMILEMKSDFYEADFEFA